MTTFSKFLPLAFLAIVFFVSADSAFAGNLKGYAWSSNIGWVSMNCEDTGVCAVSPYGVNVTPSGIMEGYAWSPFIGWVTFNQAELGGCPSGTCEARFTKTTGEVSGWMRACTVFQVGCSGALKSPSLRGNWEGWVHLRGGSGANIYGIGVRASIWSGYAWGGGSSVNDGVIGWISFAGPGYSVTGTDPDSQSEGGLVSCGGTPGATLVNRDILWKCVTFGVTPSNVEWTFNGTGLTPPQNPVTVAGSVTTIKRYSQVGDKSTTVVVNPGAPDEVSAGISTGDSLNGEDPGFGIVQIGDFDLEGQTPRVIPDAVEGDSIFIRGDIFAQDVDPEPLTVPFTSVFEITLDDCIPNGSGGGTCAVTLTPDASIQTTEIDYIERRDRLQVAATWYPALLSDTNGDGVGSHGVRLCADDQDIIVETDEPDLNRNCSPWRYFEVYEVPPPPLTGSCSATPSLLVENGATTWSVVSGGGRSGATKTYTWSGTDGLAGNGPSITKTYSTIGTKTAIVTITSPGSPESPFDVNCTNEVHVRTFEET